MQYRKRYSVLVSMVTVLISLTVLFFSCSNSFQRDISALPDTATESEAARVIYFSTTGTGTGYNRPTSGNYSPVDMNGSTAGFGWYSQTWSNGTSISSGAATFAVYSKNATRVLLEIYTSASGQNATYDYWMEKGDDNIWRAKITGVPANAYYAYRCWGPNWTYSTSWARGNSSAGYISDVDSNGNRFNPNKVLFDPYAREISHDKSNATVLGASHDAGMFGTGSGLYSGVARRNFDTGKWAPKSILVQNTTSFGTKPAIAQKDAIIYEAHVRGMTNHPSSSNLASIMSGIASVDSVPAAYRGTYKGAAYMAKYLKALGINTIEFVPVHETDNDANPSDAPGGNYWGYMTYGYFAPDRRYSYDKSAGGPTREFKEMMKSFHDEGIEVYLDVVYNHSGEGGTWDDLSTAELTFLRGFDNSEYYALVPSNKAQYWETTGCGNNLRCDNAVVRQFILDSLTYWIDEMGIDGFRFDLAPVLGRVQSGSSWDFNKNAATITQIMSLGNSKNVEMIAEAWDTQWPGGYQVGNFPSGWGEWNGRYRDAVRKYINLGETDGDISYIDAFNGDYNNFNDQGGPHKSVNFVVAHDGFTLTDLVSYSSKMNSTLSWPFGPSDGGGDGNISTNSDNNQALRRQRVRNFFVFQMFSRGVPMIVWGDEFGRTQNGNNNPYNIDSVATWSNYNMINTNAPNAVSTGGGGSYHNNLGTFATASSVNGNFRFAKYLMNLRKNSPALRQADYSMSIEYKKEDGTSNINSSSDRCAWIKINGSQKSDSNYLLLSNMWTSTVNFTVPSPSSGKHWIRIVDTANWAESSCNYWEDASATTIPAGSGTNGYGVNAWSIVVLKEVSN
ncbi:isoamylase [Brucepastera parasyntrophica]|uniref:isoamylase n=1 Tax=Brucepastera parasyntrophica TaxID=2880008 RepID=UPI00210ECF97|nr:isoamylase [Brucepastera parasyntrophica]ULQ59955.1 isoamylase [Brucepastera parasyntrophica]